MTGALQDPVLSLRVGHLVLGDDDVLPEDLDGVQVAGALLTAQDHLAEGALTQHLEELEVVECLKQSGKVGRSAGRSSDC